jgi:hypothetical protein
MTESSAQTKDGGSRSYGALATITTGSNIDTQLWEFEYRLAGKNVHGGL